MGCALHVYSVCYQRELGDPSSQEERSKVVTWEPEMVLGPAVLAECG